MTPDPIPPMLWWCFAAAIAFVFCIPVVLNIAAIGTLMETANDSRRLRLKERRAAQAAAVPTAAPLATVHTPEPVKPLCIPANPFAVRKGERNGN